MSENETSRGVRPFLTRISSRKFLVTFAAQVAGLIVLLAPAHGEVIMSAAERIAAIAAMLLAALGYVSAEAKLDGESDGTPDAPDA